MKIKRKVYRTVVRPALMGDSTDVHGRDMGVEEGTGKEIGGRRNENAIEESPEKEVEVVWACDEKIGHYV